jgi:tetratricopeptide (TPR) repeat protein
MLILTLFCAFAFGDSEQYSKGCSLIGEAEFDSADALADSMIKSGKNVHEGYTLKSSIYLSRYLVNKGDVAIFRNFDESIFSRAAAYTGGLPYTVDKETAAVSEGYLIKAIKAKPDWLTSYYTLCHMYSVSYNTDKLIGMIKRMKAQFPDNRDMIANFGDYAVNLYKRADFNSAVKVYKTLIEIYPKESLFSNDLAVLYVREGDYEKAVKYADKCMEIGNVDSITAMTVTSIYFSVEQYAKALKAAEIYSKLEGNDYHLAYKGMYQRLYKKPSWANTLKQFKKGEDNDVEFINLFIGQGDKADLKTLKISNIDSNLRMFALEIMGKENPKSLIININLAYDLLKYSLYSRSKKVMDRIYANVTLSKDEKREVDYYYAWALQNLADKSAADKYWSGLCEDDDAYIHDAAYYFLGINSAKADTDKALKYFKVINKSGSNTKYAQMADDMVNNINDADFKMPRMMDISNSLEMHPSDK